MTTKRTERAPIVPGHWKRQCSAGPEGLELWQIQALVAPGPTSFLIEVDNPLSRIPAFAERVEFSESLREAAENRIVVARFRIRWRDPMHGYQEGIVR